MPRSLLKELTASWLDVLRNPPTTLQLEQFERYIDLLREWNERINLTAITDPEGIVVRHFLDSLSVLAALDGVADETFSVIDVGTGAGFPGMALAIMRPSWQVTLLEATRKKVDFLSLVIQELELSNVQPIWGRAEEAGQMPAHREQYDAAVARAVAELPVLAEYCLPFVRPGGVWVAQKGPRVEEEVEKSRNALGQLGGKLLAVEEITIPGLSDETRTLVIVEKRKATPTAFPRRPGTPAKRPL
ncbi:MAG: 16S rRNA (guanine(527)-N(7))-methyltransferase RsmG [Chloroflexota bacterium]|nr:16S rRNA (guanine(527)-N(7))-methyltransferase RsmG [Chloroflexota bacterium]